jgi:ribonucleoside-diphosphate reductase alpha chain
VRFRIPDSRIGWKEALDLAVNCFYDGRSVYFDFSALRPMGAPLKTMGGRSSGPEVLRQLLAYFREVFLAAQGRQLTSTECHNLLCEVASVVVVGGTRRSALLSMSDLTDTSMRRIKVPPYHERLNGANNSAAYHEMPDILDFLDEWVSLAKSGQGERGIANIWASRKSSPHRRKSKLIDGVNPCGEVNLRNRGLCNVTEVVVRSTDDFESLRDKITTATWLGVIQSMFTLFPYIPSAWKENAEEERLIGVSLTGQQDNPSLLTPEVLKYSKAHVLNVARKAAKILGINMPAACTTTKPSGTVSQLVNSSPGVHPRWAQYYMRRVMISKTDPLFRVMVDQGVPHLDKGPSTAVLEFPIAAPDGCVTRKDLSAIEQLEWYQRVTDNWCEHNASCTIYVGRDEWLKVATWVYDRFDKIRGVSFFPTDEKEHTYEWLPYEEISKDEYSRLAESFPELDYSRLADYESTDMTEGAKELACHAGRCEL